MVIEPVTLRVTRVRTRRREPFVTETRHQLKVISLARSDLLLCVPTSSSFASSSAKRLSIPYITTGQAGNPEIKRADVKLGCQRCSSCNL